MTGSIDFAKGDGLVPAIVQDADTRQVLMLGYMSREAVEKTQESGNVTFFSRSKGRLWVKGEESGHFLRLVSIAADCDNDTLLVRARPDGPTCHTGTHTCWGEMNSPSYGFLTELERTIQQRLSQQGEGSYTATLAAKGIHKVAQKVGEEAVELVIEAMGHDDGLFLNEAADLVFHLMILLKAKGYGLDDVAAVLQSRSR